MNMITKENPVQSFDFSNWKNLPSRDTWIEPAAFTVVERPVHVHNGEDFVELPIHRAKAIVRQDNGKVLGIHKGRYSIINYEDAIDNLMIAIDQSKIDTSNCEAKCQVFEEGRKLRLNLKFKNHIIEPQLGDKTMITVNLESSHDGTRATETNVMDLRLICLNGQTAPDFKLKSRQIHTEGNKQSPIEQMIQRINSGLSLFYSNEDKYKSWISKLMLSHEVQYMFEETLAQRPTRIKKHNVSEPILNQLMRNWDSELRQGNNNLFGAYNAATAWATHPDTKGQVYNVDRVRHNEVAKMQRSKHWLKHDQFSTRLYEDDKLGDLVL